eukprot:6222058-Prymnesium_polylepis.1
MPPVVRLYAPADEATYVLVPVAGQFASCLVIRRDDGTAHLAPAAQLDSLIGKVGLRAKSCVVAAVVGLI